jgi:hypothetical protein
VRRLRAGYVGSIRREERSIGRTKNHGPSIKDDARYEALREKGMSKEKAARIANTPAGDIDPPGGSGAAYEDWTKEELYEKAREVGVEGRSAEQSARESALVDTGAGRWHRAGSPPRASLDISILIPRPLEGRASKAGRETTCGIA